MTTRHRSSLHDRTGSARGVPGPVHGVTGANYEVPPAVARACGRRPLGNGGSTLSSDRCHCELKGSQCTAQRPLWLYAKVEDAAFAAPLRATEAIYHADTCHVARDGRTGGLGAMDWR